MRISLDYDRTYTEDSELWDSFIAQAKARGHEVVCVTMRSGHAPVPFPGRVIFTGGIAKVAYCEAHGIEIDIWIDDQPYRLVNNALAA